MARVLTLTLLWMLQAVLVVLLVKANWIEREMLRERISVQAHLGPARDEYMSARASILFRQWFISSGAVSSTYRHLLPDRRASQNGTENLAPWFFKWLENRLDTFWLMLYQAIYRLQILREWGVYIYALLGVAVVEGIVRRQIKRTNCQLPSTDRYVLARRAVLACLFAPLLYLFLPLSVPAVTVPICGGLLAVSTIVLVANAQQRV